MKKYKSSKKKNLVGSGRKPSSDSDANSEPLDIRELMYLCEGKRTKETTGLNKKGGSEEETFINISLKNKDKRCDVNRKLNSNTNTCFSLEELVEIAKGYNEKHPEKSISLQWSRKDTSSKNEYASYLYDQLEDKLKDVCKDQLCWLKMISNISYKKEITKNAFRPRAPRGDQGRFTWLNTTNIDLVMEGYEKSYPDFIFLGAVPIDFDHLPLGISNLNFDKLIKEGKTKLGVIFNLDEHYKDGSHWVGLFSDLKKKEINFFDSYGIKPERRIMKFMDRISDYLTSSSDKPLVRWNRKRHQYGDSECGVYSLSFVIRQMAGISFEEITNNKVKDDDINKCRDVYFR